MLNLNDDPLTQEELDWLDAVLEKYGTDAAIINVSELDGFLTALVSGPNMVMPSQWLPAIWETESGPDSVPWENEAEASRFMALVMQHMNNNTAVLMESPEQYEAMFMQAEENGEIHTIVDDWCLGYMRGVALGGGWEQLPEEYEQHLMAIAIHADLEIQEELDKQTPEILQLMVERIEPAAVALHGYWLSQRMTETAGMPAGVPTQPTLFRDEPKVGRNDPCPCGSGKKFKKCCLH
ncbi:MAG: YecA family protein [Pseudomonadales bacterium]|nr:YecA family protein [Pseudomonadales bacterium]MBI27697.1 YecA family protein [Pseudomonadales bacterium]TNC85815.1 MAG: YecA family protein [Alcanivorax sp.]HAG93859.1 YecA family protein [Gammaproteobacteria bacterium]HBO95104.1 YecA family protein [Gammaproteobacteria bacterium]|tara:strand:- start:16342 stop:17052 length:711 start_codon:yes stop_codon:yes gene_type:complete